MKYFKYNATAPVHVALLRSIFFCLLPTMLFTVPIAHWSLDERSGESYLDAIGGLTAVTVNASASAGVTGNGLSFSGTNSYAEISITRTLESFSFSVWVRPRTIPQAEAGIFGRPGHHNILSFRPTKQFAFRGYTADKKQFEAVSEKKYEQGEWHHLIGVYNKSSATAFLFIDGELAAAVSVPGALFTYGNTFYAGCGNPKSEQYAGWFAGDVDDVRMYDTALTESEASAIYAHYRGGEALPDNGILGYWKFDETGSYAFDSALSNRTGRALNTVSVPGKTGQAYQFNGSNAVVSVEIPTKLMSHTYEAWVKPSALPKTMAAVMGRPGYHNAIEYSPKKKFIFRISDTKKISYGVTNDAVCEVGEWYHVAGVYEHVARTLTIYVNGNPVAAELPRFDIYDYPGVFNIGCAKPESEVVAFWFNGVIDDAKVYTRPLTADEIRSHYQNPALLAGQYGEEAKKIVNVSTRYTAGTAPKIVPPPITSAVTNAIAARPIAAAHLSRRDNGGVDLIVNGDLQPRMAGYQEMFSPEITYMDPYREGGVEIIVVNVNLGYSGSKKPLSYGFWDGKGKYDTAGIEENLWHPLRSNPNARLIIRLWIDTYPQWGFENPDDVIQNGRGEKMIVSGHFLRFSNVPPVKPEQYAWSFLSKRFRKDTGDMVSAYIRAVEKTIPSRAIIGYFVGGGQDQQMYHWHAPDDFLSKDPYLWGDYSPVARTAWLHWVEKKYKAVDALSHAWGMNITSLDAVSPPPAEDLALGNGFHDPRSERRAMDWKRFHTESRLSLMEYLVDTVRKASTRKIIVGVAGSGDSGRRDLTVVSELVRNKNIDFFYHQPTYAQRLPPSLGGFNAYLDTYALHGKFFSSGMDHPTWLVKESTWTSGVVSQNPTMRGHAKNIEELRAMYRREYAHLHASGSMFIYQALLGGPWQYNDERIIDEMRFLSELERTLPRASVKTPVQDVAIIYDERAVDYIRADAKYHVRWARNALDEALGSGVPCRTYYAEDIRDDIVPPVKVIVFINLYNIDERLRASIAKLKADGRTLVFLQGTGYEHSSGGNDTIVDETIGMHLTTMKNASPAIPVKEHALLGNRSSRNRDMAFSSVHVSAPIRIENKKQQELLDAMDTNTAVWNEVDDSFGVTSSGDFDMRSIAKLAARNDTGALIRCRFSLEKDDTVNFYGGADYYAKFYLNGEEILDLSRQSASPQKFATLVTRRLARGDYEILIRLVSGSGGFWASMQMDAGGEPREYSAAAYFNFDTQEQIARGVDDASATVLATYPGTQIAGAAVKDHGNYRTMFIGSSVLSRYLINAIASYAGAWVVTKPNAAVVSASDSLLMIHAFKTGTLPVTMKKPSSLAEYEPGARTFARSARHEIMVKAGNTYLFRIKD